jgi:stress-induced morphogen
VTIGGIAVGGLSPEAATFTVQERFEQGLPQLEDHAFVVRVLSEFLGVALFALALLWLRPGRR